jgi:anti-anti-sigma factor
MSDELEIQIDVQPDGTIVRLKGSAAINAGKDLEITLTRLCAARPNLVVVDLSELSMMASLVMGQLVALQRSLARGGGKMRLTGVSPKVMGSLEHARLEKIFEFFPTVADALKVIV